MSRNRWPQFKAELGHGTLGLCNHLKLTLQIASYYSVFVFKFQNHYVVVLVWP